MLLTTQYLEEADRLADDILVVDHGRVIARGDARQLKREVGGDHIGSCPSTAAASTPRPAILAARRRRAPRRSTPPRARRIGAHRRRRRGARRGRQRAADGGIEVEDLGLRQPTLDDVFLTLTGAPRRRRRAPASRPRPR